VTATPTAPPHGPPGSAGALIPPPGRPARQGLSDRLLYRWGVPAGVVGSLVAFPFVAFHPHLPPGNAQGVLETVRDFGPWLVLHLGLIVVLMLILLALAAFSRSIRSDERTSGIATLALVIATFGTLFAILGQGVDGVGLKVATDVWEGSAADDKHIAVLMGAGVMGVATGIFLMVLFFYFGATSLAYGVAFAVSREYPGWLAALALLGGTLGLAGALLTYFDDFSDPVYYGLFIPSAVILLLWVFAGSLLLRRRELRHPHQAA
jgi:hypothetical protein